MSLKALAGTGIELGLTMEGKRRVRCGDCRNSVRVGTVKSGVRVTSDPQLYCPSCSASGQLTLECPYCGSLVCRACGSIVESASDLGFG